MLEGRLLADVEYIKGSSALYQQAVRVFHSEEGVQAMARVYRGEAKDAVLERHGHRYVLYPRAFGATGYNIGHAILVDTPDGPVEHDPMTLVFETNSVIAHPNYEVGVNGMPKAQSLYLAQDAMKVLEK